MQNQSNGIHSLERGLALIEELNLRDGARPTELARALGMPRSSVYRILETLENLRYVERSASDSRFRVTERVRLLARGFTRRSHLGLVSGPIVNRLSKQIAWPIDVTRHEAGVMRTQETTHTTSAMSMARSMIGEDLPVLRTASGRTVLAFSKEAERDAMISILRKRGDPEDIPFLEPQLLTNMVKETRERGYGVRVGGGPIPSSQSDRTSSIAVPIMDRDQVYGALVIIWISTAMTTSEAVARYLEPMRDAAAEIVAAL
jgi:IclR family mhp operon transcriptional activator